MRARPYVPRAALSATILVIALSTMTACAHRTSIEPAQYHITVTPSARPSPVSTPQVTSAPDGKLPKLTVADLCDALTVKTIDAITGMSVRTPTGGTSTHCTWWNGTGFDSGSATLAVKASRYIDQVNASSGVYRPMSGIGIRALVNDKTLPPPIGPHVQLIVDYGTFDISLSVSCGGISSAEAFALVKSAEPNL